VPRARQLRRAPSARRADTATPEPTVEPAATAESATLAWQRLADEGQYVQALASLEASGGFDAALRDATAEQLMSLVDVARATGQRDRAIVALRRIVSEHGTDPNAPVAAWMLGNELAKSGDLAEAEQAFAMYRALSPNGDFAEDALARQIDMAAEQGNLEHARKLADQYLKEFPDGPRSADMQLDLERWGQKPAPSASAEVEGRPVDAPPQGTAEPSAPR
jgi:TolA-binding protein